MSTRQKAEEFVAEITKEYIRNGMFDGSPGASVNGATDAGYYEAFWMEKFRMFLSFPSAAHLKFR